MKTFDSKKNTKRNPTVSTNCCKIQITDYQMECTLVFRFIIKDIFKLVKKAYSIEDLHPIFDS